LTGDGFWPICIISHLDVPVIRLSVAREMAEVSATTNAPLAPANGVDARWQESMSSPIA